MFRHLPPVTGDYQVGWGTQSPANCVESRKGKTVGGPPGSQAGSWDLSLYLSSIPPDPNAPEGLSRLIVLPGWESGQPHPALMPWALSTALLTPA